MKRLVISVNILLKIREKNQKRRLQQGKPGSHRGLLGIVLPEESVKKKRERRVRRRMVADAAKRRSSRRPLALRTHGRQSLALVRIDSQAKAILALG